MVQRRDLVENLVLRAKKYLHGKNTEEDELQIIRKILRGNGFLDKFIEKHAHSTKGVQSKRNLKTVPKSGF